MITLEKTEVFGWEPTIRGMRNPMNSWDRSDTGWVDCDLCDNAKRRDFIALDLDNLTEKVIGPNDHELMMKLAKGGAVHAKYRRMIAVYVDIKAPLYWWKEFYTYKVGTVANSCSTMHKIHSKEFDLDDFSCEKLARPALAPLVHTISLLNVYRNLFVNWDEKDDNSKNGLLVGLDIDGGYNKKMAWEQMIQLLPSSYNQLRTVMLNYEVLHNIYISRKNHKLDEWRKFCAWIEKLPYSEIITLEEKGEN